MTNDLGVRTICFTVFVCRFQTNIFNEREQERMIACESDEKRKLLGKHLRGWTLFD